MHRQKKEKSLLIFCLYFTVNTEQLFPFYTFKALQVLKNPEKISR